tara:strand:+ start:1013 stop:1699 length:687 start_codon:yes stop_codon:yes gene_type:complete
MVSDINFLLVGNSRLHWAEKSQNKYKFFHTKQDLSFPKNIDLNNLIWASVGNSSIMPLQANNEITTKDIDLLNIPDHFGIDRALACLAALEIIDNPFKKDLLIADFGTILSLTKLTAKGLIIGGQLAPGFMTQLKSMAQYTKNLKTPEKYEMPAQDFLIDTEDAILKGVLNSLIGVINLAFNPAKDILIICGGDSELIARILKDKNKEFINAPNLVMEGMIFHFESSQ